MLIKHIFIYIDTKKNEIAYNVLQHVKPNLHNLQYALKWQHQKYIFHGKHNNKTLNWW